MPCGRHVIAASEDGAHLRRGHRSWSRSTGAGSSWSASSAAAAFSIRARDAGWRPGGDPRVDPLVAWRLEHAMQGARARATVRFHDLRHYFASLLIASGRA
jgi:integrase